MAVSRFSGVLGALIALAVALPAAGSSATGLSTGPGPGQSRWQVPLGLPPQVARPFAPPAQPWLSGHRGVDLKGATGGAVVAAAPGTVVYAGVLVDRPVVSIRHEGGLRSTYEPVEASVSVGQQVGKGQTIGKLVAGHDGDGLHWGAKYSDRHYVDPLSLVLGPFALKPWAG